MRTLESRTIGEMKEGLALRHTWVIGSAGGIGGCIVAKLAQNESRCISGVDRCPMNQSVIAATSRVRQWVFDGSDLTALEDFGGDSQEIFGPPEDVVVASGTVVSKRLEEMSEKELEEVYRDNLLICFRVAKEFYKRCDKRADMIKNLIFISSNAAYTARPQQAAYAAMKSAIRSLTESLALAWGSNGIRVNSVAPGTVIVDRNRDRVSQSYPEFPLDPSRASGRLGEPEDVANMVVFLLSPESRQLTGQTIRLDGGSSLR